MTAKKRRSLISHINKFTTYTVILSLIPLVTALIVRNIAELPTPPGAYALELLFFTVAVTAATLGDISNEKEVEEIQWLFQLFNSVLLLGLLGAAILFGFYHNEAILVAGIDTVRNNINTYAFWLAGSMLTVSYTVEIIIGIGRSN